MKGDSATVPQRQQAEWARTRQEVLEGGPPRHREVLVLEVSLPELKRSEAVSYTALNRAHHPAELIVPTVPWMLGVGAILTGDSIRVPICNRRRFRTLKRNRSR